MGHIAEAEASVRADGCRPVLSFHGFQHKQRTAGERSPVNISDSALTPQGKDNWIIVVLATKEQAPGQHHAQAS